MTFYLKNIAVIACVVGALSPIESYGGGNSPSSGSSTDSGIVFCSVDKPLLNCEEGILPAKGKCNYKRGKCLVTGTGSGSVPVVYELSSDVSKTKNIPLDSNKSNYLCCDVKSRYKR